ncbi:hypothetical protein BK664_01825 [Pseudomonas brassicacearum]|uniref:Uncharacterized protein n=1 Tax=Pseudomonas brassicacearum TaxID=930166 RepID=A0A423JXC5_9PSED|nr:hypothetical protein [Pseudomonas brassicacearum]RON42345.1 hypothetical protein BK664_01825 [Pseudomonas brassicacearum]
MSKKFEKLRIDFGRMQGSRKDKTWSTGSLLKNQQAKRILTVQTLAQRQAGKRHRLKLNPAEVEDRNKDGY